MLNSKLAKCSQVIRSFSIFQPKNEYGPTFWELKQFEQDVKLARKRNAQLYQDKQDMIDLDHVQRFEDREYRSMVVRALTLRTATIKLAMKAKADLKVAYKKEEERSARLQGILLRKELDRANRKRIIEMMKMDSKNWYTPETLDKKLLHETVIPDVIGSHTDYYNNLQNIAFLNEIGDMDGLEDAVFETKTIQYKNSLLVPRYARIKSLIKHLKNSEEGRLLEDFENSKAHIMKQFRGVEQKEKLEKLSSIYHKLLLTIRQENLKPAKLLRDLSHKLLIFYNVLHEWKAYTDIMKKGSHEVYAEMHDQAGQTEFKSDDLLAKQMDYSSPDEKMTTEEEELGDDFNIEKLRLMMKKELSSLDKSGNAKDSRGEGVEDKDMTLKKVLGGEETEQALEEAEQEWAKMGDSPTMYGVGSTSSYTKARDFLLKTNIESIFPKEVIDKAFDFGSPQLSEDNIDELKLKYQAYRDGDLNSLNGSIFVDALKAKLKLLDSSKLSSQDKKLLGDLFFLLDRIGEIKIVEARLLARLFDML